MTRWVALGLVLALSLALATAPGQAAPRRGHLVSASDTTYFDPDGNYFPMDSISVSGYTLFSLILGTVEPVTGLAADSLMYESTAMLSLVRADGSDAGGVADSVTFSPDTLDVLFQTTPIGAIRISGTFVDRRGRFGLRPGIDPGKTPVVRASVTVTAHGRVVYSHRTKFTYWEGD